MRTALRVIIDKCFECLVCGLLLRVLFHQKGEPLMKDLKIWKGLFNFDVDFDLGQRCLVT